MYAEIEPTAEADTFYKPIPLYALSFDGQDDYVEVADSASLDITNEITLIAWVKVTKLNMHHEIIRKNRLSSGYGGYILKVPDNNKFSIQIIKDTNIYTANSATNLEIDKWYFVAGTYDGTAIKIYVNGVLENINNVVTTIGTNNYPLRIGTTEFLNEWLNGSIAQVLIYNRSLNQSEIQYIYQHPRTPITDGLVLWLNSGSVNTTTNTWYDLSGNGNHGTIYGATYTKVGQDEVVVY